jgi:hypothetical protein
MKPAPPSSDASTPSVPVPGEPVRPKRPGPTIDDDLRWTAVSAERPCPICGATTGRCGVAPEEGAVVCQHVPSEHPLEGGGWLHQLPRPSRARRSARSR